MARQLRQLGITRVHPLLGGFHAWRERGYPLEEFYPQEAVAIQQKGFDDKVLSGARQERLLKLAKQHASEQEGQMAAMMKQAQAARGGEDAIDLAEVYWGLEDRLRALGFDYTYDKELYDELVHRRPHAALAVRQLSGPGHPPCRLGVRDGGALGHRQKQRPEAEQPARRSFEYHDRAPGFPRPDLDHVAAPGAAAKAGASATLSGIAKRPSFSRRRQS